MTTLLDVDPRQLQVNPANVRKKAKGLDELAASIAAIGVQVPLIVKQNGTGDTYVIVAGERRALAAVQADVATVPVIVRAYDDDGQAELTAMMVENLHREDLTPAEEAKGYEQLAAFGVSIDDIASLTGREKKKVESGLAVAKSKTATELVEKYDSLTFDQVAGITEFEDDPKVVEALVRTATTEPEYFENDLASLREERLQSAKHDAAVAKFTEQGVKVIANPHGYSHQLDQLVDGKGKKLTAASHKKCPGHAAFVETYGACKARYYCTDPAKHGHKAKSGGRAATSNSSSTLSDAEREKKREERRTVIANNKAIRTSTPVRRKFVVELLQRKTPPKGTLAFLVPLIVDDPYFLRNDAASTLEELTGLEKTSYGEPAALAAACRGASEPKLQLILLSHSVVAIESTWGDHLWRGVHDLHATYLRFLESCGYGPSTIEQQIVIAALKAED